MATTLERAASDVDDIDLRVGSTTDFASATQAVHITDFTLTQSCTCSTCTLGNCTTLPSWPGATESCTATCK